MFKVIGLFLLQVFLGLNAQNYSWTYADQEMWKTPFPRCSGESQSPIALNSKTAIHRKLSEIEFHNYTNTIPRSRISLINSNYTVSILLSEIPLEEIPIMTFNGETYILAEIHFHWPSEHTIDNIEGSLEAHLVHRNIKYSSLLRASQMKNGVTVIGVLYKISQDIKFSKLSVITKDLHKVREPFRVSSFSSDINVGEIFSFGTQFYNYNGSLTTPPCHKNVNWILLANFKYLTAEEVS